MKISELQKQYNKLKAHNKKLCNLFALVRMQRTQTTHTNIAHTHTYTCRALADDEHVR